MRLSNMLGSTRRDVPRDELSINAQLLMKAGFIDKTMAGVYTFLPLGLNVLRNIEKIVREEMERADAYELLMPALQPKELWETTNRWEGFDALLKVHGQSDAIYALGPTHEEVVTPLAQKYIHSYRDLPRAVYQIQTKFRDEPRAKSGLLRGREFLMKDLYSFHMDESDLAIYYETMQKAYARVFKRLELDAHMVEASGGSFSKLSHEYQVLCESGEDKIFICTCGFAINQEIAEVSAGDVCPKCVTGKIAEHKAIEVGNIFKLNRKFSDPFKFVFTNAEGAVCPVYMGCYGIGISRLMGTIVEMHHDADGIIWPRGVAPCQIHIIQLGSEDEVLQTTSALLSQLEQNEYSYLFDDRGVSAGIALKDADMIGIPFRIVISKRSIEHGGVELARRSVASSEYLTVNEVLSKVVR